MTIPACAASFDAPAPKKAGSAEGCVFDHGPPAGSGFEAWWIYLKEVT